MLFNIQTVGFVKIISIPDEELFSDTTVGGSASYFVLINYIMFLLALYPYPVIWGGVLLYLSSPNCGYCSISDDLSCSYTLIDVKYKRTDALSLWYQR